MKKLAYFKIEENMTPREVSDKLAMAKKAGYDDVIVYHHEGADITKSAYKEQLLSVFRGAYRNKVGIYIADDRYDFSGTGFGQLSSVKDLWQKVMVVKKKDEAWEGEEVLCERADECVVAVLPEYLDKFPYGHMPDLTNPECASLIIESVYKPLINEYKKFVGYEFKGFLCNCPICDIEEYNAAPYSEEAVEKYKEYCPDYDLFDVAAMGKDEYYEFLVKTMEESFVLNLKSFCDENNLEFAIATGTSSVSTKFGEENSSIFINPYGKDCYMPEITNVYEAVVRSYKHKQEPVVKIGDGMEKISMVGRFFEACPDCEVVDLKEFKDNGKDGYVLVNNTKDCISLGFLPEGEWVIYDWEKGDVCDFAEKKTYKFYPYSFLCIRRKTKEMYPDSTPVRVGGVVTGDWEEEKALQFTGEDNIITFRLPEDSLAGKCIELTGDFSCLKVKLGYNEHSFTYEGCVLPLYDFLCGVECTAQVSGGKINEIKILSSI